MKNLIKTFCYIKKYYVKYIRPVPQTLLNIVGEAKKSIYSAVSLF